MRISTFLFLCLVSIVLSLFVSGVTVFGMTTLFISWFPTIIYWKALTMGISLTLICWIISAMAIQSINDNIRDVADRASRGDWS